MVDDSSLFSISTEPEEEEGPRQPILYYKDVNLFPDDKAKPNRAFACFNCGGEHNLRDCTERPNHARIAEKRNQLNRKRELMGMPSAREFKRYHIEVKTAIAPEAKPGVVSDNLRNALGISKNQLPPYIYRMRSLGYPPGWLEEATISKTDIWMVNSRGEKVRDKDEEEGEIDIPKKKYDFSKIVDYPGFNVWPDPDTINETDKYNSPEMHSSHSKAIFIEFLKELMEKQEFIGPAPPDMSVDMEEEEVESATIIDEGCGEFIPPLPGEAPPKAPPPPLPEEEEEDGEIVEGEEEGEVKDNDVVISVKQANLKRKSDANEDPVLVKSPKMSLQDSVHDKSADTLATSGCGEPSDSVLNSSSTDDFMTPNTSLNSSHGRVISVESGTPSLKLHSPYNNLPPSEAFRKDISDVINFENLPDSTGKYEKLKNVLKSVREKLKIFQGR